MDATFWNTYYETDNMPWDAGSITTPLKEYIDQLADKNIRILIPGCGNAHEAEYLVKQGFTQVYVCDWAKEALSKFRERVPHFPESHLILADFFKLEEQFDLILEQTFFCALLPALRPAYAQQMHQLLSPKGKLVGLLFNMEKEDGPPFGGDLVEYQSLFQPIFEHVKIEECYNSIKPRQGKEFFIQLRKA